MSGRRRRKRGGIVRARTLAAKRLTEREVRMGETLAPYADLPMPATRGECRDGLRPCPWVRCRFHLYLDVVGEKGSIKLNFPDREPWELAETCALDVADDGGATLDDVGELMNLTRERVRQVENKALVQLLGSGVFEGHAEDGWPR